MVLDLAVLCVPSAQLGSLVDLPRTSPPYKLNSTTTKTLHRRFKRRFNPGSHNAAVLLSFRRCNECGGPEQEEDPYAQRRMRTTGMGVPGQISNWLVHLRLRRIARPWLLICVEACAFSAKCSTPHKYWGLFLLPPLAPHNPPRLAPSNGVLVISTTTVPPLESGFLGE